MSSHIAGVDNTLADDLSRDRLSEFLQAHQRAHASSSRTSKSWKIYSENSTVVGTAFFGFFRLGELLEHSSQLRNEVSIQDVTVDNPERRYQSG